MTSIPSEHAIIISSLAQAFLFPKKHRSSCLDRTGNSEALSDASWQEGCKGSHITSARPPPNKPLPNSFHFTLPAKKSASYRVNYNEGLIVCQHPGITDIKNILCEDGLSFPEVTNKGFHTTKLISNLISLIWHQIQLRQFVCRHVIASLIIMLLTDMKNTFSPLTCPCPCILDTKLGYSPPRLPKKKKKLNLS